ncbi:Outer membrane efflux protein [Roseovarius gaetbuli]|uniref:Outer membrane efflux protein n=1 Tax=Roseovarius gaetbuli TaxID=1356575 RepID=A0A1X6ZZR5_9RHOB|nr:TolC family protein [Roseovarius gaetbuli]SLN65932.1 Outer membrane efflux protein [Roseovarius gaetbuli]
MGQGQRSAHWLAAGTACFFLAGCLSGTGDEESVSRFNLNAGARPDQVARQKESANSPIITALQDRRSVLPSDGSFDQVAGAVLGAYSRSAEADLLSARLRAEAASKNWLPRIGPNISLTSLSDIVSQLIVEQVLFDNGRKKAERGFAKADVEVAAVTLADDVNGRVLSGLSLYLDAAEARERVALETRTLADMSRFEYIMSERVKGGVSDMSDLNVLGQKLAEIRATLASQTEAETTALAELNAMSARPLNGVTGLSEMPVHIDDAEPLDVLKAEAEKERDIAGAVMARAGLLPGLTAGGTLGDGGSGIGLNLRSEKLLGLGTGAQMRAIEAEKEAASRRVTQAEEDSNRILQRLEARLAALSRQVGEASALSSAAKANLDLFQEQYEAGQRQVMDVVGVYETFADRQTRAVSLKYELALARLEIARHLGLLADGSRI